MNEKFSLEDQRGRKRRRRRKRARAKRKTSRTPTRRRRRSSMRLTWKSVIPIIRKGPARQTR